jgi:hypothetical protein
MPVAAVVVMACSRADYLERTVKSVLTYQTPVASKYPLFISQVLNLQGGGLLDCFIFNELLTMVFSNDIFSDRMDLIKLSRASH